MHLYGYARVSTTDQDLSIQEAKLRAAGCQVIRAEKRSGANRDGRSELQVLLEFLRPGDTLVVTRIDRLARSMKDLQDIVHELKAKGVTLRATEQPIDTGTAAGKAFLDMLGVFAEFETNLRRERQLEGIDAAKARGVYKGRKPVDRPGRGPATAAGREARAAAIARRLGSAAPPSTGCSAARLGSRELCESTAKTELTWGTEASTRCSSWKGQRPGPHGPEEGRAMASTNEDVVVLATAPMDDRQQLLYCATCLTRNDRGRLVGS